MLKNLIAAADALTKLETAELKKEQAEAVRQANTAVMTVLGEVDDLREQRDQARAELAAAKAELKSFQHWEALSAKYALFETPFGSLVYRPTEAGDSPGHFLCSSCFHEKKFSYLQPTGKSKRNPSTNQFHAESECQVCKSTACFGVVTKSRPVVVSSRRTTGYF